MTERPPATWDDVTAEAFRATVDRAARGVASQDEGVLLRQHAELLLADLARYEEVVGELNTANTRLARDLGRAEAELRRHAENESADAAAGSYAGSEGHAIADPARWLHIAFTSPDETTANTSALNLADHLAAEFPGVDMRISSNTVEGESVIVCTTACDEQHTYDWTCEQFAGIDNGEQPARTTPDNPPTSEDVADNPAATEATDLRARVTALYEQWVKAGPPPLGVPTARWWDRRLVELHDAIRPAAEQPVRTTAKNPAGT